MKIFIKLVIAVIILYVPIYADDLIDQSKEINVSKEIVYGISLEKLNDQEIENIVSFIKDIIKTTKKHYPDITIDQLKQGVQLFLNDMDEDDDVKYVLITIFNKVFDEIYNEINNVVILNE
ncbi:MAG: hypothetical protein A3F40_02595 [Chlamydiae bacterium RIFCSPHIGHO2_12_FULL_27_8]|nr:MAG: hypothetical protein A3F40_02595 [Chlamydiae bacterium RIFCSPHIGHO2_12_FULL_27_8]